MDDESEKWWDRYRTKPLAERAAESITTATAAVAPAAPAADEGDVGPALLPLCEACGRGQANAAGVCDPCFREALADLSAEAHGEAV